MILTFVIFVVIVSLSIFMALKIQNKTVNYHGIELKTKIISIKSQSENVYEIPKSEINNGELAFYKINGGDGINLKKGDEVSIILNIETESVDHCVLGYCINEEYIDFFSDPISDTLLASFTAQKGGEYYIYSMGASASSTKITSGKIQINSN